MKKLLSKTIAAIFLAVLPFGTFNCFAEGNTNVNNINSIHIEDVSANSITISNNNSTFIIDTDDLTSGSAISTNSTDNNTTINNINDVYLQNVIGNDIIIVINNITYVVNVNFDNTEETTEKMIEETTEENTEETTEENTEEITEKCTDTTNYTKKSQSDTEKISNHKKTKRVKKTASSSSSKKRNNKDVVSKNNKGKSEYTKNKDLTKEDKKYKNKVKVTIGKKKISVNNIIYDLDVMPYIQKSSSSTLIPLRAVSVALSGDTDFNNTNNNTEVVSWDKYLKKVLIKYNGKTIEFTAQSNIILIDGKELKMENNAVSEIKNGRMFVPFRALGNALDVKVEWDKESKTASLG